MAAAVRPIVAPALLCLLLCALPFALVAPLHAEPVGVAESAVDQEEDVPTPAPLVVGAMALASDSDLAIERMTIEVTVDRVTYTYGLHNKGASALRLAASVAMPDLEVNTEGTTIYNLPSKMAENPVKLEVSAAGAPVSTSPATQALALGVDRLADLKAASLPLIPFDTETQKALSAASPETLARLVSLGLVTPRDPAEPDTPPLADWTLHTVQTWMQPLPANATTEVKVAFAPVKAVYGVMAAGLPGFDALKDQVCLTPQIMAAAKTLLTSKTAMLEVDDIVLSNEGPARWLDNPSGTVSVVKPKPDSVVAFCGMTPASAGQPVAHGKLPGSADTPGLRVLIFSSR